MTRRLVVYAEGSADRGGEVTLLPAPGEALSPEQLGPVHVFVRRVLTARGLPEGAIRFEAPLRVRGRDARGSDLHNRVTLRQLLRWARPDLRPELVIVIVDADDEPLRAQRLERETDDLGVERVVVAAMREFEAWLIADTRALRETLDLNLSMTKDVESMARSEAKRLLDEWITKRLSRRVEGESARALRRRLAESCDLEEVTRRCLSFAELRHKLSAR
jgi:hypothetical protein